MKKQIVVLEEGTPGKMSFGVSERISDDSLNEFFGPLRPTSDPYLKRIGEQGARVVRALMAINGVTEVGIRPYELEVTIGSAFSWHEIIPQVLRVIKREVFPKGKIDIRNKALYSKEPLPKLAWLSLRLRFEKD
ncbi:MAG: hypothetical protein WC242_03395 [Candidatus Paceibacterota bacterium]|jgi:hypothetical protein